ncbi:MULTISPECIES: lytic transglycosylase domain-containing protein [Rhizobium]|uniref:Lytic transglycosylase domain-containing protein n=1 Tax=Rhizobium rhododendri TaxID=2506430 RepID=A0ABY8IJV8_9HYPH|nr:MULTISPECIES: lytic transglycosylase domain-containing protein [Rhizobium]MBZ5760221.1 lytic transglycosylase domain-containing protein [Rhizobium sp. VS19-DR96]MBZ5766298.1 lytic transglycosylase domain-containing protein [Rhizobium sp. VS19-DR129.2]MBZ5774359.1 lytic transglycosylase domain-containing protein [Rhizobium sp. VS19-DRK62.2]MBZ5785432.1 lytic transglycosylase domain-containing protein [Rhizobium sp. VS19-DR121]MBZ5803030.1 lytic transglycosylase domain-containing protein [Rhi
MNKSILVVSATGLAIAWGCLAAGLPIESAPDPAGQPQTSVAMAIPNDPLTTGSIPRASNIAPASADLKAGLDALSNRKPLQAIAVRNGMARGTLDRHILTWAIATSGQTGIPSAEIASASQELAGWPGLASLRGFSERAIYNENPSTAEVLAAFGETAPETPEGAFVLSKALIAVGKPAQAAAYIRNVWRNQTLDASLEDKYLAAFGGLLSPADQKARMDLLLYRSKTAQAKRFGDLGKAQSLYTAWAAVNDRSPKAASLLANISTQWKSDPAYLFMRVEFERRKENYDTAAALLARMPRDRSLLIDASQWWDEQRIVSRGLVDQGNYKAAYRIADDNVAVTPVDVGEAEFHAGWYALRGLKDPSTAATHFRKILGVSNGPISVSRAWYWLGRAAEAGGPGKASDFYAKAAALPSTFYGQLAAKKLGRQMLDVTYPSPSPEDRQRFQSREAVLAIARLEAAGNGWRADSLYRALAQQLQSPGEIALLAASAEQSGNHQLSLQVGKIAYGRGVDVAALAFPIGVIPDDANIAGSGKAMAYAIARQESAFNPQAVSSADARGLLQLLPKTAKAVAGRHGIVYSADRLTKDAGYNATLGSHYLGEQIDAFGGSYILTFVAYNAGPKKVPEWISRYGDPRGKSMDEVVDWIERIPFPETRNYVQRVMENYEVYKARLGQKSDIEQDLIHGRG